MADLPPAHPGNLKHGCIQMQPNVDTRVKLALPLTDISYPNIHTATTVLSEAKYYRYNKISMKMRINPEIPGIVPIIFFTGFKMS